MKLLCAISILVTALAAASPLSAQGSSLPAASLAVVLFDDPDGSGGPSCGDPISIGVLLSSTVPGIPLENVRVVVPLDPNTTLIPGTLVVNPPHTVVSGNDPGDTVVEVLLGDVDHLGASLGFRAEINNPNPASQLSFQGTVYGDNFPPIVTDNLGTSEPDDPFLFPYDPCPGGGGSTEVTATKTDSLATDLDGDGLVDEGETVRYSVLARATGPFNVPATVYTSNVDPASTLATGSVTTTQGTVLEGNTPGDTRVVVDMGTLTANAILIRYDVVVADPVPLAVSQLTCQGRITAPVAPIVLTDDPDAPGPADPTVTPLDFDPDLVVAKTDGGAVALPGGPLAYTLDYGNASSRVEASGSVLTDTVPAHTTFDASGSSPGWTCTPGPAPGSTCTLALGTLAPEASGSRTFALTVAGNLPPGVDLLTNTASIADDGTNGPDGDPSNNTDTDTTPLDPAATVPDLTLAKDDGGISTIPGATIAFTLTYANTGPQGATGVTLTETVPDHATFNASASSPGWVCTPGPGPGSNCTLALGTLAAAGAGGTATFAVDVVDPVPAGVPGIVNTAMIADDGTNGPDPTPANNIATDDTPFDPAGTVVDLAISKDDGGASAGPGELVAYTLSYANTGNRGATGVEITDVVPPDTTFEPAASSPGWACSPDPSPGSTCTLAVGGLTGGAAVGSATFAVRLDTPQPAGVTEILNTASIADDGTNGPDADPSDNTDSDTTPISGAGPDLTITKLPDPASDPTPGGTLLWTLTYTNNGNQGAPNVVLTDTVPAHTTFEPAASSPGWTCTPGNTAGSTCELPVGTVPGGGGGGTATFAVVIDDPLPAGVHTIENCAEITDTSPPPAESLRGSAQSCSSIPVTGALPDLALTKDDGGITAQPGDPVAYTVTYQNLGNQGATGVTLTDTVPAHTTFDAGASTPAWSCPAGGAAGSLCTLALPDLPAGASGTATFAVVVDDPVPAGVTQLVNSAVLTDDGTNGPDPDPDNNLATDTTPLTGGGPGPQATLDALKTDFLTGDPAGNGVADPGDVLTYLVEIPSTGDAPALATVFSSAVDPNTTLVVGTVSTSHGSVPIGNGTGDKTVQVDLGDLPPGETATVTYDVAIADPLPPEVHEVACQGSVSATNHPTLPTDDPDTPEPDDPTVTPILNGPPAELTDIPTLSGLGLVLLVCLLGAAALLRLRRQEIASTN